MSSHDIKNSLDRLWRRFMLSLGYARIQITDDTQAVQFVQVKIGDKEIIDKMPRLAEFGFTSNCPIDSDAMILFMGGDRSKGVVIATGNQAKRLKNLAAGESAMYDALGKYIYLTATGIVIEAKNQPVTVNNASAVTINCTSAHIVSTGDVTIDTPHLKVSGDIIDNYGTNTRTMAGMRTQYNSHTHSDPQGGTTGTPNNSM